MSDPTSPDGASEPTRPHSPAAESAPASRSRTSASAPPLSPFVRGVAIGLAVLTVFACLGVWMIYRGARGGVDRIAAEAKKQAELVDWNDLDTANASQTDVLDSQPVLANGDEVRQALLAAYPPALRYRGVPGMAMVRFKVMPDGTVHPQSVDVLVSTSGAFADAARKVVPHMRFTPATSAGHPASAWVTLPLNWQTAE
ncbi:MAG: TonB family C-terminal protein [Gemmatimonadetes bacterium]|nr:TonB family C-terminal protein [Gemmatimonadota bacterium]